MKTSRCLQDVLIISRTLLARETERRSETYLAGRLLKSEAELSYAGKQISETSTRDPGFRAGIKLRKISAAYLSDQLCRIHRNM